MGIFDWLIDNVFDRQRAREQREEMADALRQFDETCARFHEIERRARATFTPEEWAACEARCEAILAARLATGGTHG